MTDEGARPDIPAIGDPGSIDDATLWQLAEGSSDSYETEVLRDAGLDALDAYDTDDRPALLAVAIHWLSAALGGTKPGKPGRAELARYLGNAYRQAATVFDRPDLLDDALSCVRQALKEMPAGCAQPADILSDLGAVLFAIYAATGDEQALVEAGNACGQAVEAASPDDPELASYWMNCSLTRRMLGELNEDREMLDAAIEAGLEACDQLGEVEAPIDPLIVLEGAHLARYDLFGAFSDIDQAVKASLAACPP
jgi:hypothetical protein